MPIEQVSPGLERIVLPNQELEELGSGYDLAEGPIWYRNGGYLLFSEIDKSRRHKWTLQEGVTLFKEPTGHANGLTRDLQGRLLACETSNRRVAREEPDGTTTAVAGTYQGKRLNGTNDVVVKSDGSIYFTDPGAPAPGMSLDFSGVYRVSPDLGEITLLVRDFIVPNGLAFSPDESILYVDDSFRFPSTAHKRGHIRAFDVLPNGMLALSSDRIFCELTGPHPGVPDGMKVDVEGNVYCTGPGGVWVIDSSGKHLGTILTGAHQTTNCGWGGDDLRTLFITTWHGLFRIQLQIPGLPVQKGL